MHDQLRHFLKQEAGRLPFLSRFWDIATGPPATQSLCVLSLVHQTAHYPVHTFYKSLSIHLNLEAYD